MVKLYKKEKWVNSIYLLGRIVNENLQNDIWCFAGRWTTTS